MNCTTARLRLLRGTDAVAELHLETCQACFEYLEMNDPATGVLIAARADLGPGPGFAGEVIARWRGRRAAFARAGTLVAATAVIAGLAVVALLSAVGERLAELAAQLIPLESLFDVPRALLLENTPNLIALGVVAGLLLLVAGALYRQLGAAPRRLAR